jgi:hypothetical protein
VISVDTKKELVGPFKNNGREWEPRGEPMRVGTHDFPDRELGRAVPYGVYDVVANTGWVNVGTDHDTADDRDTRLLGAQPVRSPDRTRRGRLRRPVPPDRVGRIAQRLERQGVLRPP